MDYQKKCEIAASLLSAEWKFAKTAAKRNPHWYTLRKTWENDDDFMDAVLRIRDWGYDLRWRNNEVYRCWNINELRLWTMGCPVTKNWRAAVASGNTDGETILINAARNKRGGEYDKVASQYDLMTWSEEDKEDDDWVINQIGQLDGTVLDIGCGTGFAYSNCLLDRSGYVGIDPSPEMIGEFRKKHEPEVRVCSYEEFYHPHEFDNIISTFGSISYVDPKAFSKMRFQLKKGGRFWFMFVSDSVVNGGGSEDVTVDLSVNRGVSSVKHKSGYKWFKNVTEYKGYVIASGSYEDLPS